MDYIYQGEVQLLQDYFDSFLDIILQVNLKLLACMVQKQKI